MIHLFYNINRCVPGGCVDSENYKVKCVSCGPILGWVTPRKPIFLMKNEK